MVKLFFGLETKLVTWEYYYIRKYLLCNHMSSPAPDPLVPVGETHISASCTSQHEAKVGGEKILWLSTVMTGVICPQIPRNHLQNLCHTQPTLHWPSTLQCQLSAQYKVVCLVEWEPQLGTSYIYPTFSSLFIKLGARTHIPRVRIVNTLWEQTTCDLNAPSRHIMITFKIYPTIKPKCICCTAF